MRTIPLEMCFKGQRDYLQGADIFNALSKALTGAAAKPASQSFTLAMHNFSRHQCDLVLFGGEDGGSRLPMPELRIADFTLGAGSSETVGWLSERESGWPVTCRHPFDESEIAQRCNLAGQGNTVSSSIPLLLENAVSDASLQTLMLSGFGVGLSWASAVLKRASNLPTREPWMH